jgi:hypothetical protein
MQFPSASEPWLTPARTSTMLNTRPHERTGSEFIPTSAVNRAPLSE